MITITPISAFSDNYIWCLIHPENNTCAVVDPGDAAPVLAYLNAQKLTLKSILITHHHWDHTGGVAQLKQQTRCHVYGPAQDPVKQLDHACVEPDEIYLEALDVQLKVLDIPAHTLGHIAFYNDDWLFCGDTLFSAGCGRVFEGTYQQMFDALNKLKQLSDNTQVYCGHEYTLSNLKFAQQLEPSNRAIDDYLLKAQQLRSQQHPTLPSTIGLEKKINPFLRCEQTEIAASARQHAGQDLTTPLAVFTEIRKWKSSL